MARPAQFPSWLTVQGSLIEKLVAEVFKTGMHWTHVRARFTRSVAHTVFLGPLFCLSQSYVLQTKSVSIVSVAFTIQENLTWKML